MSDTFELFNSLQEKYNLDDFAFHLSLHKGTIKRWIQLKEVPSNYYFDLCRMGDIEIDYSKFTEKEKDQFFTSRNASQYCIDKTYKILQKYDVDISKYHFIEPSAGDGSFYDLLPKNRRTGIDIESKNSEIKKSNFLLWRPKTSPNIVIGNPPFGLRGNLALKFINHASQFSDFVCFILPQSFNSAGKGSCKARVTKKLSLIHNEIVNCDFNWPDGSKVKVNVVFQIWSKLHKSQEMDLFQNKDIKIYSLSDGGDPGSTRNKKYLNSCDYYLPSTCFGKDKMKIYYDFEELPHRRGYGIVVLSNKNNIRSSIEDADWKEISFMSTNGAYNLRTDLINQAFQFSLDKNMKLMYNIH